MVFFKRIFKHYMVMALERAGVRVDGDVISELESACDALSDYIAEMAKKEAAIALAEMMATGL